MDVSMSMRRIRSKSIAVPILVGCLYGTAALLWFVITPPFEAPDENLHYDFIVFLATTRKLPDANPATRVGWQAHEWIQPPLYYALMAPIVAFRDPDRDIYRLVPGNANNTLHNGNATRTFTWDGRPSESIDTFFYTRLASLLMGGLTVLFIYWAATRVLPCEQAGLAAAMVALIPQYGYLTAALSNDTLASLVSAAAIGLLLVIWQTPRLSLATAVAIGLLSGAAVITKIHTVFLLPTIALAVLFRARGRWMRAATFLALVAVGAFMSAGWYFIRNAIVFGDPLASRFKLELLADVAQSSHLSLLDPYFYTIFPMTLFRSFWASFGWLVINPPDSTMMAYAVVSSLLFGVTLAYLIALPRRGLVGRPEKAVAAVLAVSVAAGGIAGGWTPEGSASAILSGFAAVSGMCIAVPLVSLVVLAPRRAIERRECEIAVTLSTGIAILVVELVAYNITWPYSHQGRLLYPALAPMAIVSALALRHAFARLRWPGVQRWALAGLLMAIGVLWTISFHSALVGFHGIG